MPTKKKANEAQFFFFCSGQPEDTFEVMNFSGVDEVSSLYKFDVTLISENADIDADDVINKQATLLVYRDEEYYPYSGIVMEFKFMGKNHDRATYVLKLAPKLWLLELSKQSRIFQKKTVPQILKLVLDNAQLSDYYSLKLDDSKYPELEYVVQYQESDLNFISRLMEKNGIWYFFNENPLLPEEVDGTNGSETLLITDKTANFESIGDPEEILFRTEMGMTEQIEDDDKESVHGLQYNRYVVPTDVLLKDYNYRTPEVDLTGKKAVTSGDTGSVYEYGGHFKNVTEAANAAGIESDRLATQQIVLDGAGNCRGMRAGKRFTLTEHFKDDLNTTYVLTQVLHLGAHTMEGDSANVFSYRNRFRCIPSDRADMFRPQLRAAVPRLSGIITAQIEANGSSYAGLDDMGRYKVRLPFDVSNTNNYDASRYIRLAQPYSGANYGMHFPSHEGAEMVLACIDGNPDRPLGIATVPNANTLSPVVGANQQQSRILTAGGNELVLDDTDQKQKVRLSTSAKNTLLMDDENQNISLKSTNANELLLDDKNELVKWNGSAHSITMNYHSGSEGIIITTKEGNTIQIDDNNKKITIHSKAGHSFEMDDDGKTIVLADCAGKNKVTLDGNGGIILDSQGKIQITAQQDIEITGANIKMTANNALEADATADLKLHGMNVEAKADMNIKVEAQMNLDLKGTMQATLDGMMAQVSGDTMTTIKGGMVMIN
ncbi:MAG: type VI secretion system tip protein TssI/VgrG [Chitinivibrionales bacterium]